MYNAIYYKEMYFLLPEEFSDYSAFIHDLRSKTLPAQYCMVVLREDHKVQNYTVVKGRSMVPYFLSGYHDAPSFVVIASAEDVYPVQVEVLDQAEYNAKLREVINRVCPGCLRFKPLSNRVQSLNGHFEEITLDGVCVFRQESKPAPRIFHDHLFSYGGFFKQFNYATQNAQEMKNSLKTWFYICYAGATLNEEKGRKTLTLQCKKNELLAPILTNVVSHYTQKVLDSTYHICLEKEYRITEESLIELLAEKNSEVIRKECKKYGVSLAVLKYDANASEKIQDSLKPLIDHFWVFPLLQASGKAYYLVADTSYFFKELRYRSPLLQSYNTTVDLYDQYQHACYQISFDMNKRQI